MNTQKEWTSFRITLLLYVIVFIIPIVFYLVHTSFTTTKEDTKIIRHIGWLQGVSNTSPSQSDKLLNENIRATLDHISVWVNENKNSELYLGGTTLSQDYDAVKVCLNSQQADCSGKIRTLTLVIENMIYLRQNKLINIFYLTLAVMMFLSLLIIYLVRTYIRIQMKKHAIHDHETHLYNKKYFLSLLESACAKSTRYKEPLSVLWISLSMDEELSKKTKQEVLKRFGVLVLDGVRTSDTPAKYYSEASSGGFVSFFSILLPYTQEDNSHILENRLRESLAQDEIMKSNEVVFKFAAVQFEYDEQPDVFIARSKSGLKD